MKYYNSIMEELKKEREDPHYWDQHDPRDIEKAEKDYNMKVVKEPWEVEMGDDWRERTAKKPEFEHNEPFTEEDLLGPKPLKGGLADVNYAGFDNDFIG